MQVHIDTCKEQVMAYTTGTYQFTIAEKQRHFFCAHETLQLANDPKPTLKCNCGARWDLSSLEYGQPVVIDELCGMCEQPCSVDNDDCAMHELRHGAIESVRGNSDDRLSRAALGYAACILQRSVAGLRYNTATRAVLDAIKLLETLAAKVH